MAEHGQNSIIGELEAITGSTRSHTVHAIRESELVRMPMALFNAISTQHPATTIRFLRLIASRVRKASEPIQNRTAQSKANATSTNLNLKTICVMPMTRNVPVAAFAERLRVALEDIGAPTAYLDQATAIRQLGKHAFTKMGKLKVGGWLGEKESRYRMVLYVVDTPVTSSWTMTSIKQVSPDRRAQV
jgi:lysophospholipid hydrolase